MRSFFLLLGIVGALFAGLVINRAFTPSAAEMSEKNEAAIRDLVDRYYAALRAKQYEQALTFYEEGYFDLLPGKPVDAVKAAAEMVPIPEKIWLEKLKIYGGRASAWAVIDRRGMGPAEIEVVDQAGRRKGTFARAMTFRRTKDGWKISLEAAELERIESMGRAGAKPQQKQGGIRN